LFQAAHLVADRGLGDAQLVGSICEAHVTGGGLESTQSVERRQGSLHGAPSHEGNLSKQDKGLFVKDPRKRQIALRPKPFHSGEVPWPISRSISVPRPPWQALSPPSSRSLRPGAGAPATAASLPRSTTAHCVIWG